jgi:hypothetical protein
VNGLIVEKYPPHKQEGLADAHEGKIRKRAGERGSAKRENVKENGGKAERIVRKR